MSEKPRIKPEAKQQLCLLHSDLGFFVIYFPPTNVLNACSVRVSVYKCFLFVMMMMMIMMILVETKMMIRMMMILRRVEPQKLVFGECHHRFSLNSDASVLQQSNYIVLHCDTVTRCHHCSAQFATTAFQAGKWLKVCGGRHTAHKSFHSSSATHCDNYDCQPAQLWWPNPPSDNNFLLNGHDTDRV